MSHYSILVARLQQDLVQLAAVVEAALSQLTKAEKTGDLDYLQAAALSLQNFYMGVERMFEEIAKQIDRSVPKGASFHRDLLTQMTLEVLDNRPSVVDLELSKQLNEYRGFRHVVMHRYGFELYPERIRELVTDLPDCYRRYACQIQNFCQFLIALNCNLSRG